MGASTFTQFEPRKGDQDTLQAAFGRAVESAQYEYGHSGYTGTLAEKHSVKHVEDLEGFNTAYERAQELMLDYDHWCQDKWGPAAAIRVTGTMQRWDGDAQVADGWLFFGWASD